MKAKDKILCNILNPLSILCNICTVSIWNHSSHETRWSEFIWYCTRRIRSSAKVSYNTICSTYQSFLWSSTPPLCYATFFSGIYASKVWWNAIYLGLYTPPTEFYLLQHYYVYGMIQDLAVQNFFAKTK